MHCTSAVLYYYFALDKNLTRRTNKEMEGRNEKKLKTFYLLAILLPFFLFEWPSKSLPARASMSSDILARLTTWRKTNMDPSLSCSYYFLPLSLLSVHLLLIPSTFSLPISILFRFLPSKLSLQDQPTIISFMEKVTSSKMVDQNDDFIMTESFKSFSVLL